MKLAYVANYSKTIFFSEIANRLNNRDHEVFWFVVNKELYNSLIKKFPEKNVLLINEEIKGEKVGEFKLNELIYGDRTLKYQKKIGVKYLLNIQEPIYNFILDLS